MSSSAAVQGQNADMRLYSHRFLFRVALGAGTVFAWVLLFQALFFVSGSRETSVTLVALLYALSQGIAFILTPLTGAALRRGVRRALVCGTLTAGFAFACMSLIYAPGFVSNGFAFDMIAGFVILMGLHRALYWIPYATEQNMLATHPHSGSLGFFGETILSLMPLLGGIIIETQGGPGILFALVSLFILASLFPISRIPESYEGFEWGYGETLMQLFAPGNRSFLTLSLLDGVQGVTLLLIWPLAAFIILGQSFLALGVVLSATFLISSLGRTLVRRILRALKADRSTSILAIIAFSSWMFRLAAASPIQVILADVYYHAGVPARRFSIDTPIFEQSADGGHYIDEYTALKEMGMALGRIAASIILAVVCMRFGGVSAFVFAILCAGLAAAASVIISRRLSRVS
ncbi:MAG: hypothetical protein WAZ27_05195 [Minisyncoccia bacterium]